MGYLEDDRTENFGFEDSIRLHKLIKLKNVISKISYNNTAFQPKNSLTVHNVIKFFTST